MGPLKWLFEDAENTACFSCRHVMDEGSPILRVAHDEDDGAWQFLCGELHDSEDARLVCLGCMIVRDRQLMALADLPVGWCAGRDDIGSGWVRELSPAVTDDEEGG
jgi:hypothetical protein